jgi:hypothetical protein
MDIIKTLINVLNALKIAIYVMRKAVLLVCLLFFILITNVLLHAKKMSFRINFILTMLQKFVKKNVLLIRTLKKIANSAGHVIPNAKNALGYLMVNV